MSGFIHQATQITLLILGFGFVIFWHELGHFLAAKWAGVRIDQFAVGFGHAMFSWRKGLGVGWGSSATKVTSLVQKERERTESTVNSSGEIAANHESDDQIRNRLGLGETEYRLNWIPLGGYVKMLGQDDLNPNATASDPHAYNMKPIGKRMVIVSAGVIMNVILAAIGFFALFLIGYDVPPPVVGKVLPNSPAQRAGIHVGDRIISFDGRRQRDFTKIMLTVALLKEGEAVPVVVEHAGQGPDHKTETLSVTPARSGDGPFLQIGVAPSSQLEGPEPKQETLDEIDENKPLSMPDTYAVNPGEKVIAIGTQKIDPHDEAQLQSFWILDKAIQDAGGKPVPITVTDGKRERTVELNGHFIAPFTGDLNFAGLEPRAVVNSIIPNSNAKGKLVPGDIVEAVTVGPDTKRHPTLKALSQTLHDAGDHGAAVNLIVNRDGKNISVDNLTTVKLKTGGYGLGIGLDYDGNHAVVAAVEEKSTSDSAGISVSDSADISVTSIAGQPVSSFHDIRRVLAGVKAGTFPITVMSDAGEKTFTLNVTDNDISESRDSLYAAEVDLRPLTQVRKTSNFFEAARWGLEETRDLIIQFYVTLRRMIYDHSLSPTNMMGPLGIAKAGAAFASHGNDSLLWFLCMISANLAVVNFLPIPIVDGGLFVFLVIEKFQGKPLSPRVQAIAQYAGLALIGFVLIFVTYQDIVRH